MSSQPPPLPNTGPAIQDLVVADIVERKRIGIERYGMPLQGFNGRDALRDAYEEALDLCQYLRQAIYESQFIWDVLGIAAHSDCHDCIWWRMDGEYAPITFFVQCNDFFYWATADCERINPEDIPLLRQSIQDAGKEHEHWGFLLFCARKRKMRPQDPACPKEPSLKELFMACGPERTPRDQEGMSEESYKRLGLTIKDDNNCTG